MKPVNKNNFSGCKPGEKLWERKSWGEVKVRSVEDGIIRVMTPFGQETGYPAIQDSKDQELFFSKPYLEAPAEPLSLPDIPVDTLLRVNVGTDYRPEYAYRYFKEWTVDGKPVCFQDGTTSKTASREGRRSPVSIWSRWEIPDFVQQELDTKKAVMASLECTISWLKNGCDPQEAAKEVELVKQKLEELWR